MVRDLEKSPLCPYSPSSGGLGPVPIAWQPSWPHRSLNWKVASGAVLSRAPREEPLSPASGDQHSPTFPSLSPPWAWLQLKWEATPKADTLPSQCPPGHTLQSLTWRKNGRVLTFKSLQSRSPGEGRCLRPEPDCLGSTPGFPFYQLSDFCLVCCFLLCEAE